MSLTVGRVFGVEIKIHYTWLIIFFLVTWSLAEGYVPNQFPNLDGVAYWVIGAISSIALFVSVLIHELAHSYIALRQGIPVSSITLFIFGGVSQIVEEPASPGNEAKMAAVGPLSSFGISGILALVWVISVFLNLGPFVIAPLSYITLINILLGGFNLIPAFPLDGGRILRAGFWKWKKNLLKATKLSTKVSEVIAYGMIGLGFASVFFVGLITGLWLVFIGWFLKSGSDSALRQTIVSQALSEVEVREIMNSQVVVIPPDDTVAEVAENFFEKKKHGGYPVVDENEGILGIVTESDIQDVTAEKRDKIQIREVMTPKEKLISVLPDEPALEAMIKLSNHDVGRLIVLDHNKLVGIVTRSDLMKAIRRRTRFEGEVAREI